MRVASLASGSSGNATIIEAGESVLLLDAGLPLRTLQVRIKQAGYKPDAIQGILLTHEHTDHAAGAIEFASIYQVPLIADARTIAGVLTTRDPAIELAEIPTDVHAVGTTWQQNNIHITSFPIPHDAIAPCGYYLSTGAWSVCLVTDCGSMNDMILGYLRRANLIIIEANHDRDMLLRGRYPAVLKKRIMSKTGHLANDEAANAIFACLDGSPHWVWLAHLSKTNNTPELAATTVTRRIGTRLMRSCSLAVTTPSMGPIWDSREVFTS
jgi:phosphoribosyl 1,2-cyclic phosphodiesterase